MPAKIQKKSRSKKSFAQKIISIFVVIFVLSLSWLGYRSMMVPTDINLVSTQDFQLSTNSEFQKTAPTGCYYKPVQCIQDPCPEQLICDSTTVLKPGTESGRICTQETGTCADFSGSCITYTDGCEKSRRCAPDQSQNINCRLDKPTPTITPMPGCTLKSVQCVKEPCAQIQVCEEPKNQICTQVAGSCMDNKGVCVGFSNGCEQSAKCAQPLVMCGQTKPRPSQTPMPTSKSAGVLTIFDANQACGESHYSVYTFTCSNGQKYSEHGLCTNINTAMANARAKCRLGL